MSAEKIIIRENVDLIGSRIPEVNKKQTTGRVDINNLLARVRAEKKQENKLNLISFGFFIFVIFFIGIFLSL